MLLLIIAPFGLTAQYGTHTWLLVSCLTIHAADHQAGTGDWAQRQLARI